MARIAGVDLPRRKAIAYALPYIYGIGSVWAKRLCKIAGIPEQKKVDELTEADVKAIREAIEGNIKAAVPEWNGVSVQIAFEQTAYFDGARVIYAAGRQTTWHLVR